MQKKLPCVSGCIAFCARSLALSTHAFRTSGKYHYNSGRTISMLLKNGARVKKKTVCFLHLKLPSAVLKMFFNGNMRDRNIYLRVLKMVFKGLQQDAKSSGAYPEPP